MTTLNSRQLYIACALVLFLASVGFPRPFLSADSHGVMAVAGSIAPENLQVASTIESDRYRSPNPTPELGIAGDSSGRARPDAKQLPDSGRLFGG